MFINFIFNFYCSIWEFSRVSRYGFLEVGHKNVSNTGIQVVVLFPIGCNKLFHKAFATKNKYNNICTIINKDYFV